MKKLFLKTWRDINVRKGQFTALIVLVALGITSYVAFVTSYENLSTSADYANERLKLADFSVRVIGAPKTVVDDIADIKGVKAVEGRLIVDTGLELSEDKQAQARIIGVPAGRHPKVNDILMLEGDYLGRNAEAECLLQNSFAKDAGVGLGDRLAIRAGGQTKKIKVTGIASSAEYFFPTRAKGEVAVPGEFAVMFVDQSEAERLFGLPPSYNDVAVLLREGADRDEVISEVENLLGPYHIVETVKQEDQPSNFALREEITQNQTMAYSMPFLILVISALALFIALSRLVQSQRGEIGLSKALGYRDWQILLHYLLFSLFIALAGSAIGFALGNYGGRWFTQMYIDILNIPVLRHAIRAEVAGSAILLSVVSCLLAGLVPAFVSARMRPAQAMHADPNIAVSGGRVPLVERLLGPLLPRSFTFRIPLRNVGRARRRSLYTVIGIAFAVVLTVATWAMFDSIDYMIDYQFSHVESYDMLAAFGENFPAGRIDEVAGWKGVDRAQGALQLPAKLDVKGKKHEGAITAMDPGAGFHGFDIIKGVEAEVALRRGGVVFPATLATKLDVEVGDKIKVKTPYLDEWRKLEVLAINDEVWSAPIFVSLEQGRRLIGSPGDVYNSLYVDIEAGDSDANEAAIRKKLYELPGAMVVYQKTSLLAMIEEYMSFAWLMFGVMFAFAFTMAFVVIYNTFTANVIERTREIATMQTIGEDRAHLALMVTLENLLLTVVGIPIGIYLGFLAARALLGTMSTEAYSLRAVIYPQSYVWIVASMLAVMLLSVIPPVRRIFRLNLAEATKVME